MGSVLSKAWWCGVGARESSVVENQELTQIFMKYMYDIVLKISFLELFEHFYFWRVLLKSGKFEKK